MQVRMGKTTAEGTVADGSGSCRCFQTRRNSFGKQEESHIHFLTEFVNLDHMLLVNEHTVTEAQRRLINNDDKLGILIQAMLRKSFGSEATKRAGCYVSSHLQGLAGADDSADEFFLDASAFLCRERSHSSACPALSGLL